MKFRSDFVTNSSSSSFIGVFAKIEDKQLASKIINEYDLGELIKTGKQVLEHMSNHYLSGYGADWAGADLTPRKEDIDPNAEYIIWESYDGADESAYIEYDDDGYIEDYDYANVVLLDFEPKEIAIYDSISEENGFSQIDAGYGAGRDG